MKKNYITPNINVVQVDTICSGNLQTASVYRGNVSDVCIGHFDVVGEEQTKTNATYTDLWGESNSEKWGED